MKDSEAEEVDAQSGEGKKLSMEERQKKLEQLRAKMVHFQLFSMSTVMLKLAQRSSARDNRASVVEESTKLKTSARDAARLERQRKLAETLRSQADAEARGEDAERAKNWEWTRDPWRLMWEKSPKGNEYTVCSQPTFLRCRY